MNTLRPIVQPCSKCGSIERYADGRCKACARGSNKRAYKKHGRKNEYRKTGQHSYTTKKVKIRRDALAEIVAEGTPMTVRQVFYQATVKGLIPKTEQSYQCIKYDLREMRFSQQIAWSDIVDNTRWVHHASSFDGVQAALDETARSYRKNLWRDADDYVEIWIEKDALTGIVYDVTYDYDVPLYPARGDPGLSFLHEAAEHIAEIGKPTYIYQLGDYDPNGMNAAKNIEFHIKRFVREEFFSDTPIYFERIALTRDQIDDLKLPTRPTKQKKAGFTDKRSAELDALHPDMLRKLVRDAIEIHLPTHQLEILKAAEESERLALKMFARKAKRTTG